MVGDAEQHRDEDRRLRELTDARNELDAAAYQVEQLLSDRGSEVPVHEKARAENLVTDARQALKQESTLEAIRNLTGELRQVYQALAAAGAAGQSQAGGAGQPDGSQPGAGQAGDDDDVIDAEFTTHE